MSNNLWNQVLSKLQREINRQAFNTWFENSEGNEIRAGYIQIKVEDDIALKHIETTYNNSIKKILKNITNSDYIIEYITDDFIPEKESIDTNTENILKDKYKQENDSNNYNINPNYTFENFVKGNNNQLAHAVSLSVAKSPGKNVNPFFIYGQPGVGKTHLLHAIGNEILKTMPYKKIMYIAAETFINDFILAIVNQTTESFKIKYRTVDVLLIDDIQFLEKKVETQNEFFHTFNELHNNNKQIIITSDKPPRELSKLEERLKTRFEWGMLTDIQKPDLETREAILRKKAQLENIMISNDIINYIAKNITSSIRALESALNRLKILSEIYNRPITEYDAQKELKVLFDKEISKKITINSIISIVAEKNDVSIEDIKSKSRKSGIVKSRFLAIYLSRKLTDKTTSDIGEAFGGRDHSTIVNAMNNVESEMKKNIEYKEMVETILNEIKQ